MQCFEVDHNKFGDKYAAHMMSSHYKHVRLVGFIGSFDFMHAACCPIIIERFYILIIYLIHKIIKLRIN